MLSYHNYHESKSHLIALCTLKLIKITYKYFITALPFHYVAKMLIISRFSSMSSTFLAACLPEGINRIS